MADWQPMEIAPTWGVTVEAEGLDWGIGPGTTIYRAHCSRGTWFNNDWHGEELCYLFRWRELPIPLLTGPELTECPRCGGAVRNRSDGWYCVDDTYGDDFSPCWHQHDNWFN